MEGISAVIPNYNGMGLLEHTLPTVLQALKNQNLPFEVILSDDASTDGSVDFVARRFPEIQIITQPTNKGFSSTANLGISVTKYDWVLLLNSDVKLSANYFHSLIPYMNMPDCFGVMGRIVGWDNDRIQDGAKYAHMQGMKIKTSGNYLLADMNDAPPLPTIYLSGANMFVQKAAFVAAGRLNEIFSPFYVEDFELCLRAWRLGYRCLYEYEAVCQHRTSHSIKKNTERNFVRKIYDRNKMFLHAIHLDSTRRFCWYLQVTFECISKTLIGHFYFTRAYGEFLRSGARIRQSRKELVEAAKQKKLQSVGQVMRQITNFMDKRKVVRF